MIVCEGKILRLCTLMPCFLQRLSLDRRLWCCRSMEVKTSVIVLGNGGSIAIHLCACCICDQWKNRCALSLVMVVVTTLLFTEMRNLCSCALGWLHPGSRSGGVLFKILKM